MTFSSIAFLFYFLPVFLALYTLLPPKHRNNVLVGASLLFYAWGAPLFVYLLLLSCGIDHLLLKAREKAISPKTKKLWWLATLLPNIGLLLYFKYANFFYENLQLAFQAWGTDLGAWKEVALPIGISFYTFQKISYLVDIRRKQAQPVRSFRDYLLYILCFPQLIAGPIVRYQTIALEIQSRSFTIENRVQGLFRFGIGLLKKLLIANNLGAYAQAIFSGETLFFGQETAALAILAYAFQIYFDFSAYSDMAIGLGRFMGFHFPENFNSPYISTSITEFWRRWHMTLSAWMRDYLYIPLGGNRVKSPLRLYANLSLVFLISGFWHGASWNFVIWGAMHGALLVVERLGLAKVLAKIPAMAWLWTFFWACLAWIPFASADGTQSLKVLRVLLGHELAEEPFIRPEPWFWSSLVLALCFSFWSAIPALKRIELRVFEPNSLNKGHLQIRALLSIAMLCIAYAVLSANDFNPFIYFRF